MKKLNFAPTVIAIDAAYVNRLTASLKEFSEKLFSERICLISETDISEDECWFNRFIAVS